VDVEWEIAIRKAYGLPDPEAPSPPGEVRPPIVDVGAKQITDAVESIPTKEEKQ